MKLLLILPISLFLLVSIAFAYEYQIKEYYEISSPYDDGDRFGYDIVGIGDVDGDLIPDMAVLNHVNATLTLYFLNLDGTEKGNQIIDSCLPPFNRDKDHKPESIVFISPDTLAVSFPFAAGNIGIINFTTFDHTMKATVCNGLTIEDATYVGYGMALLDDGRLVTTGDSNVENKSNLYIFNMTDNFDVIYPIINHTEISVYIDDIELISSERMVLSHPSQKVPQISIVLTIDNWNTYDSPPVEILHDEVDSLSNEEDPFGNGDFFGRGLAAPGDLDGDGIADVIVGARGVDVTVGNDTYANAGEIVIAYLNSDGTLKDFNKITNPNPINGSLFGNGLDSIGDVDNDGIPDIAVGAHESDRVFVILGKDFIEEPPEESREEPVEEPIEEPVEESSVKPSSGRINVDVSSKLSEAEKPKTSKDVKSSASLHRIADWLQDKQYFKIAVRDLIAQGYLDIDKNNVKDSPEWFYKVSELWDKGKITNDEYFAALNYILK